jgi:hypothetical protein
MEIADSDKTAHSEARLYGYNEETLRVSRYFQVIPLATAGRFSEAAAGLKKLRGELLDHLRTQLDSFAMAVKANTAAHDRRKISPSDAFDLIAV